MSGGKVVEDKTQEDLAAFGITDVAPRPKESNDFEVWDQNWDAVMMFLRMQTQWQASMSGYVGLKYEVLLGSGGLFELYNVEDRQDMLERLQVLEASALTELRRQSDAKKS